jgi:hypothetical protein
VKIGGKQVQDLRKERKGTQRTQRVGAIVPGIVTLILPASYQGFRRFDSLRRLRSFALVALAFDLFSA